MSEPAKRKKPSYKLEELFEAHESQVRSYCRSFPVLFTKAKGHLLWSEDGREYIDFFAGAGALNYGHNEPRMKQKLIEYLMSDGIVHGLDMSTAAKARFIDQFQRIILQPRGMNYKIMFPGPTGTNSVESALKLARKVTGRELVIAFTNSFHGMTAGSLAVTGNLMKRQGAGVSLHHAIHMPYNNFLGDDVDTLAYMERFLEDDGSGVDTPAAVIVETIQGEGGINTADDEWLRGLRELCNRWEMLLIVDDVQAGCGRTGPFFSFEPARIEPDIVCLSKSISGYGLPMALTLIKPEYDIWEPGEHNGTFRGHNPAFVTATEALNNYWRNDGLTEGIQAKAARTRTFLQAMVEEYPEMQGEVRGRGLLQGIACGVPGLAENISKAAFERGLIVETSGPNGEVIKLMPPLTIDEIGLERGLARLEESIHACTRKKNAVLVGTRA